MRLNPTLLLLLLLMLIFSPSITEWVTQGDGAWYRPHIVWLGVIIFVYWGLRGKEPNEF